MSSKKPHYSYTPLGKQLDWVLSNVHDYALEPSGELSLRAKVNGSKLGPASTLDHIIWDYIVERDRSTWCDSLTMWTKDIEFNLHIFGNNHTPDTLRCTYFDTPDPKMCKEHLRYWGLTIGRIAAGCSDISDPNLCDAIIRAEKNPPSEADGVLVKTLLPKLVVWNRYEVLDTGPSITKFKRHHALKLDAFRAELQTIPIPTSVLEDKPNTLKYISNSKNAATKLYELVLNRYQSVTGCGNPMRRNLLTLASLLVDPNIRVALITGEPGTGKENLSKAIYYGDKIRKPPTKNPECIFVQTTAVEIQSAMRELPPKTPSEFLRGKLREELSKLKIRTNTAITSPLILIDELNKAEQEVLGAMLRLLEQGKDELQTKDEPKYVLAASQHIDKLAKKPPQDFWTRVSHQLRVVHPLSRVSEEDGEAFLCSFFYSQWWSFIEVMIRDYNEIHAEDLIKVFVGEVSKGEFSPAPLCDLVRDVFVNTLVPLVSRDTLSVRGARSILSQVFARLSWFVRFQKPLEDPKFDAGMNNRLARLVNSAVQDVMAILNPARSTPAGMDDLRLKDRR